MSEDEIIKKIIERMINPFYNFPNKARYIVFKKTDVDLIEGLLELYIEEKTKSKCFEKEMEQNKNREKIKICMTHNLPQNTEIVCMIREDFERNFGNDYINKERLKEVLDPYKRVKIPGMRDAIKEIEEEIKNVLKEDSK